MEKDNNTKPELNKEEYLKSLFNGAKDELEAYIVSKDQSISYEKTEEDISADIKLESENISESKTNSDTDPESNPSIEGKGASWTEEEDEKYQDRDTEESKNSKPEVVELGTEGIEKFEESDGAVKDKKSLSKNKSKDVIDDIEKRRQKRKRKLKMPGFFTRIFIIIGVIIAVIAFSLSGFFTVDTIDVQGNKYFTDEEISNMAHASTGQNIIYKLNKGNMLKYLEKNPYIEEARVYRNLPSTIVINVKERMQIAALTYGDQFLIIDNKGTLLRITKTKPKLTIVTGFKVKKVKLGDSVEVGNPDLFKKLLSLLKSMEEGDVYFIKINITELFITANVYDSLVVKSKYKDLKENIDKGRLHKVLDELFKRNIRRGTITISSDGYASFTPEL